MNRKEQRKEIAHKIAWENSKHYDPTLSKESWCEMAAMDAIDWADENPREGLWDKDKVCRWIREHLTFNDDKWYTDNDYVKGIMDEVIEDLTKAMEEE